MDAIQHVVQQHFPQLGGASIASSCSTNLLLQLNQRLRQARAPQQQHGQQRNPQQPGLRGPQLQATQAMTIGDLESLWVSPQAGPQSLALLQQAYLMALLLLAPQGAAERVQSPQGSLLVCKQGLLAGPLTLLAATQSVPARPQGGLPTPPSLSAPGRDLPKRRRAGWQSTGESGGVQCAT